jgi:acetate---CoA ligase (ADP-forming)
VDAKNYLEPAVLKDGGSVLVRAVLPSDDSLLAEFFRLLSPRSMQFRFLAARRALPPRELAQILSVDFENDVALVAILKDNGTDRIIGLGQYLKTSKPGETGRAEFAVTVSDAHQGRGIGTLLLERLAWIARAKGIEDFEAEVLAENDRMLEVFAESGFELKRTIDAGVFHVVFPTEQTQKFIRATTARERRAAAESVRVFFEPKSVAIVGASRRKGTIGHAIAGNLKRCGFKGPIFPINPGAAEIEGLRCYPSLAAVGSPIDLVVVAVPAPAVEAVVTESAQIHARGVVIISAGFAEVSAEGRAVQNRLVRFVRSSGMRMVGPNCMGVLNADPKVNLNATFAPTWPPSGNVSILSQSGALGLAMLDHAESLHIGMTGFVSVGNKSDVSGNDLISYWMDDPGTRVIALYLESFGNPRKFARLAPEVAMRKPIVAVKSGRSAAGTRAASSHSAALASLDVGVDAIFARAGVIRTDTLEELFDVVALLSTQPVPEGTRIGVVTNAGGPGILLADACEAHGLTLPVPSDSTLTKLRSFLPAQAGLQNPVDMIASASAEDYVRTIEAVGQDPNFDALIVIYIPPLVTKPEEIADAIARAAGTVPANKPIATVFMSSRGVPPILSKGARGQIPSYSFPENAALAMAAAARYGRWRRRPTGSTPTLDRDRALAIRRRLEPLRLVDRPAWIPLADVAEVLSIAGIPFAPFEQVPAELEAASDAATRIGYPVVAKAVAPGVIHKSDVGGVALGLGSAEAVRSAVAAMLRKFREAGLAAAGVVLQRQVSEGIEALVGATTDPNLGPLIVAGLGGVHVELVRDVAFRSPPISDLEAAEMLGELRSAQLLDGYRGAPPGDRAALVEAITRLSALVDAVPEILEIELNPIKVLPPDRGVIAVDARLRVAPRA